MDISTKLPFHSASKEGQNQKNILLSCRGSKVPFWKNWKIANFQFNLAPIFKKWWEITHLSIFSLGGYCSGEWFGTFFRRFEPKWKKIWNYDTFTFKHRRMEKKNGLFLELMGLWPVSKPLMRKVRTSRRHLWAEKRAINGTWCT